jgi:phytoene synthase
MSMDLEASYRFCRRLARRTGKNFYYSFLTLPRAKHQAMCAIYAWMRLLDDCVDDAAGPAEARESLERWEKNTRAALAGPGGVLGEPPPEEFHWPAFVDTVQKYNIPDEYFFEIIRGAEMDLSIHTYTTFEDLYQYCYRVASVVGLACLHVLGFTDPQAKKHGEWLGIAFQLTNILRDVKEDAGRKRVYLPTEDLKAFKITVEDVLALKWSDGLRDLIESYSYRAETYYRMAKPVFDVVLPEARPTLEIMTDIYGGILRRLREINYDVLRQRAGLTARQKWKAVIRHRLESKPPPEAEAARLPDLKPRKIAIIGGGAAGLAAASALAGFGHEISLFEKGLRLGGKAAYLTDPRRKGELENPLHIWVGGQTSAERFFGGIGARRFFERHTQWHVFFKKGLRDLKPSSRLPVPLRWLPVLRKLGLGWIECSKTLQAMWRLVNYTRQERENLDRVTFLDWLRFQKESDRVIDHFWKPFLGIGIPDRLSGLAAGRAAFYLKQVQEAEPHWHRPKGQVVFVYNETCKIFLKSHGVKLHLHEPVSAVYFENDWRVVTKDGAQHHFDDVVVTLPHHELKTILSPKDYAILTARTQFERLACAPALVVKLEFRQPLFDEPYTLLNEAPFAWAISAQFPRASGVSRAPFPIIFFGHDARPYTFTQNNELLKNRVRDIWENVLGEGNLPDTEIWCDIDRDFASEAGSSSHRPDQETSLPGLWLAGDWTNTGWPAGLEGSINSGYRCAEKILRKLGWNIRFS